MAENFISHHVLTYFTEQGLLENGGRGKSCFNMIDISPASIPESYNKQLRLGRFSDLLPFRRLPIYVQTVAVETKVTKLTAAGTVPGFHGIPLSCFEEHELSNTLQTYIK